MLKKKKKDEIISTKSSTNRADSSSSLSQSSLNAEKSQKIDEKSGKSEKIDDKSQKIEENGKNASKMMEEDSYLNTLIESDQLEPAVRAIFEAMKEKEISQNLNQFIAKKENEIDDICSWHYQEFINAVDELMEVKSETRELNDRLIELNEDFQKSGKEFLKTYTTLVDYRHRRSNISIAIDLIQECQFILNFVGLIELEIKERQFYSALRKLRKLEEEHLNRVKKYSFVEYLKSSLPQMKERIRKESTEEFNNWLLELKMKCGDIGKFSIDQTAAQLRIDERLHISTRRIDLDRYSSPPSQPKSKKNQKESEEDAKERLDLETIREGIFQNERYSINFTPLYQCLQVYKELGIESQFQNYYQENRKLQANKALKLKSGISFATQEGYKKYFYDIAGIFVVEDAISKTTLDLVPTFEMEKLWQVAVAKIKGVLQEQMSYTLEPQVLLQVKHFLFLFSKTMQGHSYDVSQLLGFFDNVRTTFADLAVNSAHKKFISILDREKWEPLVIKDEKEYETHILQNKLQTGESRFLPQTFRFSRLVPEYCIIIKNLIIDFYKFAKNLPDLDEYTKKSTETLIQTFNNTWIKFVSPSATMIFYARSWVNLDELDKVTYDWEDCLSDLSYQGTKISLNTNSFEEFKSQLEAMMLELVEKKAEDLVTSMKKTVTEWSPSSCKTEPRSYAQDIVLWLESNLLIWEPLPLEIQSNLQFRLLQKISRGIVGHLSSDQVYRFNSNGIRNLDVDLKTIQSFVERSKVNMPTNPLSELSQLIELLLSDQITEFQDPQVRKQHYPRLFEFSRLLHILSKFKEETRIFSKKNPKDQQIKELIQWLKSTSDIKSNR
eukprot:TRINITY_DN5377_c0_g1_i2.p1 TRINITY_DN5377_c0_g1~~TRINITY_DN5377_c0_g1_i2.p1  ORF type:complete len:838 (-),score=306.51 TRINITY_DN5377_c0_g1_i2:585-3098(-)